MRLHLLAVILMASVAAPASAQQAPTIDKRVGKLESEMRAVQRKVFPGGNVEPEIRPETPVVAPGGVPASSAIADLTARVDALEAQLQTVTRQGEENAFRLRQLEDALTRLRSETEARAAEPVTPPPAAAQPSAPAASEPAPAASEVAPPSTGDAGEDAYLTGYRQWEQKNYAAAQKTLEAMAKQYPKHKRASYAANLAGRAYLDDGKPATAAKVLLANYQNNPTGERAADSLYFLGQALMDLKKPAEACKVYDELRDVYGATMRAWLQQRLPQARTAAKCR
ncbi:tetratricopeptide repeat protein [Sphingomonas sp. LY54]|uniref:tetratricopeptide repeat protein n=1 Tax=Sphingomonas sp. LY54 TaxID=3095343 RepID=UPI002D780A7F|nr:tetratricopeptide repeat protein [Sphingomonas sp. LY54]WRP29925.1 tetratricopeptide repeat protein [Sphingomonas sp. LY54]